MVWQSRALVGYPENLCQVHRTNIQQFTNIRNSAPRDVTTSFWLCGHWNTCVVQTHTHTHTGSTISCFICLICSLYVKHMGQCIRDGYLYTLGDYSLFSTYTHNVLKINFRKTSKGYDHLNKHLNLFLE